MKIRDSIINVTGQAIGEDETISEHLWKLSKKGKLDMLMMIKVLLVIADHLELLEARARK